jgi:hypothetical protein
MSIEIAILTFVEIEQRLSQSEITKELADMLKTNCLNNNPEVIKFGYEKFQESLKISIELLSDRDVSAWMLI